MRFAVALVAIAALAACDNSSSSSSGVVLQQDAGQFTTPDSGPTPEGGTTSDGGGNPGGGSCTLILSGAVSKTIACTLSAAYDTSNDTGGIGISSPPVAAGAPEATFALKVTGELRQTTYTAANSAEQGATVYEGGSSAWVASQGNNQGSSQVQLTTVTTANTTSSGKVYAVHGTITATLIAQGGASGTVDMMVTF